MTKELLHEILRYENGEFFWKTNGKNGQSKRLGKKAGCLKQTGYFEIKISGKHFRVHRLVWLFFHGHFPEKQIDHINGVKTDNRIENLREATASENMQNRPEHLIKKQPVGVSFKKETGKFMALAPKVYLNRNAKKQKYIGYFHTQEAAEKAVIDFCSKETVNESV